jgi:hypothetical protein
MMRVLTHCSWVCSCVKRPKPAVDAQTLVQLMNSAVGLLADSDPGVRNAASDAAAAVIVAARRVCGGQGELRPLAPRAVRVRCADAAMCMIVRAVYCNTR